MTASSGQVRILLTALGEAAGSRHDRAAMCADGVDQSCATCQWWLRAADAYDQIAAEMTQAAQRSATQCVANGAGLPAAGANSAADREAGQ